MTVEPDLVVESEPSGLSLSNILDGDDINLEKPGFKGESAEGWDEESTEKAPEKGYCIECEDQPAQVFCVECNDNFCDVCFAAQHHKGTRKRHSSKPTNGSIQKKAEPVVTIVAQADTNGSEDKVGFILPLLVGS
jgi:hypothetical protein